MQEFSNHPVDLNTIAPIEPLDFCDLDDNYPTEVLITTAITLLILFSAIAIVAFIIPRFFYELPLLILFALLFSMILWLSVLAAKAKKYLVREHDLIFKSGLFWHQMIAVSYNRIQHIDLTSGPLERRLNLTSLKIFTAGGASSDLVIPGLRQQTAQKLRDMIINQTNIALESNDDV